MSPQPTERGGQSGGARYIPTPRWHPLIIGTYPPNGVVAPEPTPEMHIEITTNPAFTGPTRRISGSFSPATWHSSLTMARRCCCLPATSWWRTELATVGAWLGTCRPPWRLSSSERTAVRFRPARAVAIAMNRAGGRRSRRGFETEACDGRRPAGLESASGTGRVGLGHSALTP